MAQAGTAHWDQLMRSIATQRHRVNRVINFAQSHIGDPLDLDTLADVACLSKYHFTRVFSAHVNETPIDYLRRIRLERAGRHLAYTRARSITDVAMDCGFSSSQTFSRAFRQRYHASPRSFRSTNLWCFDGLLQDQGPDTEMHRLAVRTRELGQAPSPVQIESRPGYRVAYIRHIGPYGDLNGSISAKFAELEQWARSRDLWREDTAFIGICPDSTAVTPARFCLYDAGMPVPAGIREDDIVSIQNIPAGTYAVLTVKCKVEQIYSRWEWLSSCWLPVSGETYEFLGCYEFYPPVYGKPGNPETGVELCLRIGAR